MRRIIGIDSEDRRIVENRDRTIRTEFGLWMDRNLMRCGLTHAEVGEKLHIAGPSVTRHVTGYCKPSFRAVVAYCWVFGSRDDPEEIWKLIDKEVD